MYCELDVKSEGKENFLKALSLLEWDKALAYSIDKERMIFYWAAEHSSASKNVVFFPYEMTIEQAGEFAWGWLESKDYSQFEDSSFGDTYINKGWRVYNETWGYVNNDSYAFVAIEPYPIFIGK